MRCLLLLLLAVPLLSPVLPAQEKLDPKVARYELGLRLRELEGAWERADPGAKARALEPLLEAVQTFFRFRMADAAEDMDRARLVLEGAETAGPRGWASSLVLVPGARLLEVSGEGEGSELRVDLRPLYPTGASLPAEARLRVSLLDSEGETLFVTPLLELEEDGELSLDLSTDGLIAGDHRLRAELCDGEVLLRRVDQTISLVPDAAARLARLGQRLAEEGPATLERATAERLVGLVADLAAGRTLECDHPAAGMLSEAERLLDCGDTQALHAGRPGEFRLRIPLGRGHIDARLAAPPLEEGDGPRPLVVLMHGAGGSDNLFFEGYGRGLAVRLALERGWVAVAPKAPLFGGVDVPALVDALADRYRIDRERVMLVGHSMGAAQALAAARAEPGRYRALAAIGGGRPSDSDASLASLPVLVATGTEDFARSGAEALAASLERAEAPVTYDLRQGIEHLTIVQECLPEVFAFLDDRARDRE
jgi:predicted esterase